MNRSTIKRLIRRQTSRHMVPRTRPTRVATPQRNHTEWNLDAEFPRITQKARCALFRWCFPIMSAALIGSGWALSQSPPAQQKVARPSLVDRLLEDPPANTPAVVEGKRNPATDAIPPPVVGADAGRNGSLLARIGLRMQAVSERLEEADYARDTQQMQEDILADLEALIEQSASNSQAPRSAESGRAESGSSAGSGTGSEGNPDKKSATDSGSSTARDTALRRRITAGDQGLWGSLPKQVRDQLRNVSNEQVVQKYQPLVDAYYKRLSESDQQRPFPDNGDP